MQEINVIFFGTDSFAAVILQSLLDDNGIKIDKVVTMKAKPMGRKQIEKDSPVKILAIKNGLEIQETTDLNEYTLPKSNDYLNIVVDFGIIIPQSIIDHPKYKSINIHPSLLPKYRGPSPIQSVLINGEKKTGTTIMIIDAKMDHGPILAQKEMSIENNDDYFTLREKLGSLSTDLLKEILPQYINGTIKPQEQNEEEATFCKMLKKEDGKIYFNRNAGEIYNQYRGTVAWPGIYTELDGKRLKLLKILPSTKKIIQEKMEFDNNKIYFRCNEDSIEVLELQLEGKKAMDAKNFINGYKKTSTK